MSGIRTPPGRLRGLRTPLGRARGLGSAKEGVQHWWMQRLTAIALVPLSLWFIVSMIGLTGAEYKVFREWMTHTHVAVLLMLLVAAGFHHAQLGLQVVIEDYVHREGVKLASLILLKFVAFALAVGTIYGILRIAIGGQ
jgi:succinate dehydrogenase / fumarate reductase, membrane anchor subunit